MRRLLNEIVGYFAGLTTAAARGWNRFFFAPADPTALGLIRLCVGSLAFWNLAVYGLDLHAFFGSDGWASPGAVREVEQFHLGWKWSFWFLVPDHLLVPVWVGCLVVFALFTAGLWSRVTAVLAWVIVVSTVRRVPVSLFGFDQALSTWLLYLAATGASGQAVSLDRFFARWRQARAIAARRRGAEGVRFDLPRGAPSPSIAANLSLRLIQLHLCLIYGMAGLAKLQGPAWWSGMAIWGTLASGEFRLIDFTWLASFPLVMNLLTHGSLALEISYPALIWGRWTRPLVLGLMVMLHVGIGLTAPGLSEFGLAMIAGNLAFVSGGWLRSLVTGLAQDSGTAAGKLLFDGACPRCRASMALVTAADPDHMIEPIDLTTVDVAKIHPALTREKCMEAMHLVSENGRVFAGYDALVALGRWCPLFWPAGWIGGLPGLRALGRRGYKVIADTRPREACNDDTCSLPTRPEPRADSNRKTSRSGRGNR